LRGYFFRSSDLKRRHEAPNDGPIRAYIYPIVYHSQIVTDHSLTLGIAHRLAMVITHNRLVFDLDPFTEDPVGYLGRIPRILIDRYSKPTPPRAILAHLSIGFMAVLDGAAWVL
jgi:hypothetical protein